MTTSLPLRCKCLGGRYFCRAPDIALPSILPAPCDPESQSSYVYFVPFWLIRCSIPTPSPSQSLSSVVMVLWELNHGTNIPKDPSARHLPYEPLLVCYLVHGYVVQRGCHNAVSVGAFASIVRAKYVQQAEFVRKATRLDVLRSARFVRTLLLRVSWRASRLRRSSPPRGGSASSFCCRLTIGTCSSAVVQQYWQLSAVFASFGTVVRVFRRWYFLLLRRADEVAHTYVLVVLKSHKSAICRRKGIRFFPCRFANFL